jgi:hypothetical protein
VGAIFNPSTVATAGTKDAYIWFAGASPVVFDTASVLWWFFGSNPGDSLASGRGCGFEYADITMRMYAIAGGYNPPYSWSNLPARGPYLGTFWYQEALDGRGMAAVSPGPSDIYMAGNLHGQRVLQVSMPGGSWGGIEIASVLQWKAQLACDPHIEGPSAVELDRAHGSVALDGMHFSGHVPSWTNPDRSASGHNCNEPRLGKWYHKNWLASPNSTLGGNYFRRKIGYPFQYYTIPKPCEP